MWCYCYTPSHLNVDDLQVSIKDADNVQYVSGSYFDLQERSIHKNDHVVDPYPNYHSTEHVSDSSNLGE